LFLGQDFEGLTLARTPQMLADLDNHFILCGIEANFWWIYKALRWLPVPSLRHFLLSRERIQQVELLLREYTKAR
jgi:hypothetical protein